MSTLYNIPQKVNALNLANAACNEYAPKVVEILKKWIGKKIALSSGARVVKFGVELSKLNLPGNPSVRAYLDSKYNYSIWLKVSGNVWGDKTGDYQSVDSHVLVGHVIDGILDGIYDYESKKCDWTAEEIEQSLCELQILESQCDALKRKIPFSL